MKKLSTRQELIKRLQLQSYTKRTQDKKIKYRIERSRYFYGQAISTEDELLQLIIAEEKKAYEVAKKSDSTKKFLKECKNYPGFACKFLAKKLGNPYLIKKFEKFNYQFATDELNSFFCSKAYYICDFGKLRKTYSGENCDFAGINTTDNGKWGWDKVVWHHADYTAIISGKKGLFIDSNNRFHFFTFHQNFIKIDGKITKFNNESANNIKLSISSLRKSF